MISTTTFDEQTANNLPLSTFAIQTITLVPMATTTTSPTSDEIASNALSSIRICATTTASIAKPCTKNFRPLVITINTFVFIAPQPNLNGMMLPSTHWTIERVIAISMLPMYPIAFIYEPFGMEYIVAAAVSMHAYWGFGGVIRDYVMERRYGPKLQPILMVIWKVFCATGFAGFCYFNYYDMGIIKGIKKLWHF
ncbi:unnamed protein product [Schistocephalus solidus]|uniref:Succinate dehydrogenase [ubiquinone] cytochrome b small subunit n=1 Tax=Schistocephalus solidus TaxID=70667 RepID=A0A183TIT9_SCHSO|nr:unnamed protein product [Schistocephalus solidus]